MAAEDPFSRTSDDASIALLRSLRSGAADRPYVHRIDVCTADPEDLVANLEPVPGTDLAEDGYGSIWYFYCPKRFKNTQGKPSGHRQRAIAGGETCWHSEAGPKPVKGLDGATLCNLSYGRKEGSSRSFNRLGWCMTEYDDKHGDGGDHVLCKVYRSSSSLAKGKSSKPPSSSTKPALSKQTTQLSSGSKRKATSDQVEARPTKMRMPAEEEQVQQNTLFTFTTDELLGGPEYDEYGALSPNSHYNEFVRECCGTTIAMAPPDASFFEGLAF